MCAIYYNYKDEVRLYEAVFMRLQISNHNEERTLHAVPNKYASRLSSCGSKQLDEEQDHFSSACLFFLALWCYQIGGPEC
jgi:hypothetical protein